MIEDYLSKALDPFPVRAYMTLPTIELIVPAMRFKRRQIDIRPVLFSDMDNDNRRRLLQAFVRFELRCKIYDPRVWLQLEGSTYADMINMSNETLRLNDHEELYCVHQYFRGLYGAVFAHCNQDSWLPERPVSKGADTDR